MVSNFNISTTTVQTGFNFTRSFQANHVKFGILLVLQFLSIPCFLYVFYQFGRQPQLRRSIHNHVILLLLMISFIFVMVALPLTQAYMYTSYVYPTINEYCHFWNWFHYSLNIINLFLMTFASLERNWLIFHPWLVRSQAGKILFHYSPLLFCLLYPPMFYMSVIFIRPCRQYYYFTQLLCRWPCFYRNQFLNQFDLFFNNYTPLSSIPIFCLIIYLRVLIQKRSMKLQVFKWKRDKKMIIQLCALSSLYLGMWMPIQLASLVNTYWNTYFLYQAQVDYIFLFPYFIHLIYPFIILLIYRKEMFRVRRTNTIALRVMP